MSFSLTTAQILDRSKTVTRRAGWANLRPGQEIRAVKKCMGLKPGEKIEPLAVLRVISVRREPLQLLIDDVAYGYAELQAEGFPDRERWHPASWVAMFCGTHSGCMPETEVTRIEFDYVTTNTELSRVAAGEETK